MTVRQESMGCRGGNRPSGQQDCRLNHAAMATCSKRWPCGSRMDAEAVLGPGDHPSTHPRLSGATLQSGKKNLSGVSNKKTFLELQTVNRFGHFKKQKLSGTSNNKTFLALLGKATLRVGTHSNPGEGLGGDSLSPTPPCPQVTERNPPCVGVCMMAWVMGQKKRWGTAILKRSLWKMSDTSQDYRLSLSFALQWPPTNSKQQGFQMKRI